VSRAGRGFHRLLDVCSWCEVGEVGLDPAQTLDVLFGGHGVVHVELAQLDLVLGVHCATAALRLEGVDLLQQLDVDLEQQVNSLLLTCLSAGRLRRTGRTGGA